MAVVDVVIPTYRGIHPSTNSNLTAMVLENTCRCGNHAPWKCTRGKHSIRINPHQRGSSVVHWARNQAITMALYGMEDSPDGRPPAEYFFLMDDDMLCLPGHLPRLLGYKADIVTGIATVRNDPPRPNIYCWNPDKGTYSQLNQWDWDANKLIPIDAVGAAYMLVKREVFERMAAEYLRCSFERAEDKRKFPRCDEIDTYWDRKAEMRFAKFQSAIAPGGDWKEADCWWFQFLDNMVDSQLREFGEDLSFCWKAKQLGYKIFADPQVIPGHVGEYSYNVLDWRAYLEQQIAEGNPPPDDIPVYQELHAVDRKPVGQSS